MANKTPIELVLKIDEDGMTTASAVYQWLELNPTHFARWCKDNIVENDDLIEGVDYWETAENGFFALMAKNTDDPDPDSEPKGKRGRPTTDYKLTMETAKKLCLRSDSPRKEEAIAYFIGTETALKRAVKKINELSLMFQTLQDEVKELKDNQYQDKVNIAYLQMGALDYQPSSWYFEIWKHLDYYRSLQATYECRCDTLSKLIGKVIHNAQIKDEINYTKRKMIEDFGIDSPEKIGVMQVIDYDRGLRTSFHDALNRMIHKYEHAYDMGEYHDWMDDYLPPVEKW